MSEGGQVRKRINPLWNYFTKLTNEPKIATCNQCSRRLSHRTTITNLKSHLMNKHNGIFKAYMQELKYSKKSMPSAVSSNQTVYLMPISSRSADPIKYEIPSPNIEEKSDESTENIVIIETEKRGTLSVEEQKFIDAMFLKMIVRSYQPVSIVEEQGFIEFVRALNSDYVLPENKDVTDRLLPEMYNKCLEEQNTNIQQEAGSVCLTIDRWTSIKMDSLIAITAHFITPDFQFKSVLLRCCEGTNEQLVSILTETCIEWEIFGKINWCVSDDSADIVQAVNSLDWNHCGCMANKLNLTLRNSLKLCDQTLNKVKETVRYFQSNCKTEEMLLEYQTMQGLDEPLMLLDSVPTSWTSIYSMIERFVALEESIKTMISEHDDDLPFITTEDWSKLKQLCKLLKPFNEATKELGADKYACASKAIAVVNGLKDVLQELSKRPDYYCFVTDVVESIEAELNERFQGIENDPNLALCTILDSRYKISMFLDESAAEMAKLNLVSEVHELMKDSACVTDPLKTEGGPRPSKVVNDDEGEFSLWRRRTIGKSLVNQKVNHHKLAQQEVESYLQEELADGDPYQWWQSNELKFPHLAKLFKTRCNMVATSVPSEQIFTEAGNTLCERRNRLSVKQAEKIVFLNANLKDGDYFSFMP